MSVTHCDSSEDTKRLLILYEPWKQVRINIVFSELTLNENADCQPIKLFFISLIYFFFPLL